MKMDSVPCFVQYIDLCKLCFVTAAGSKILVKDPRPALGTPSPKLSGKQFVILEVMMSKK